ncbi:F-actin-capping protein subunit alpha-1-like [Anneissia japonica]|uniref:F-actin-capping protein subunit alpha-1-like n=1 Tax=Anneissia japonica TaxID=1529436 RepID=UPI0014255800|nr:F-actin-capping protein subunit alpha-1-like [Anneissia japonica]
MANAYTISDEEKTRIVKNFIKYAPPGEFNEVFNDVRILLDNDKLLKEKGAEAFAHQNKEQFTPCKLEGQEHEVLITEFGDMRNNNRFFDPSSKTTFKYDHLKKEASNIEAAQNIDQTAEKWRSALETAFRTYIQAHYQNGVCTVYGESSGSDIVLTVCLEHHLFQPFNFWNGRWRSQWSVKFNPSKGSGEAKGLFKAQVHYYEDGNVQLVSHKEVKKELVVTDPVGTAKECVKIIEQEETFYQKSLSENYIQMSDTTFKALRRQLPVTRTKIDWNKIAGYKIGQALKSDGV